MPLQATSGAASYDAFGGGVVAEPNYIESVFSTYLYTGNGSTGQTITNGIDLAGKGGLIWVKDRVQTYQHVLWDTARGTDVVLRTDSTNANASFPSSITYNNNGFRLNQAQGNENTDPTVSWTFRKQPKFFDVQTWTGTGSPRTIAHNLGSVPGFIIVKRTDTTGNWICYHRSLNTTAGQMIVLNLSAYGALTEATSFNSTAPTSTVFTVGTGDETNGSGGTFVAYIFAHDAGGFGLTGTDNVISCGSFTTDSSWNATVNLGYEPQFILYKSTSYADNWYTIDNMRGWSVANGVNYVSPNLSAAEANYSAGGNPTATGFQINTGNPSSTYIYIAIRRGPMKVPTSGTSVFSPISPNNVVNTKNTTGFPIDLQLGKYRAIDSNILATDRLRGISTDSTSSGQQLRTNTTNAEDSGTWTRGWDNTGFLTPVAYASTPVILWNFQRAPSFFDEVCYTGAGGNITITHNLGSVPELIIVKNRTNAFNWAVYSAAVGPTKALYLNTDATPATSIVFWNNTSPTSSVFTVGDSSYTNQAATPFVAYLFSTCAGVSKVGSYTGTATTKQIDCGFTAGARFVLIKKTSGTGSWYVWDSARGIVSGNDPYLLLNSTAAEVTNTDYIDTYSAGFEISSTAPSEINENGGSFIFLAIA